MTRAQALREATRRWGRRAVIRHDRRRRCRLYVTPIVAGRWGPLQPFCPVHHGDCPGDQPIYEVGETYTIPGLGTGMILRGVGRSWAEALAKAR